MNKYDKGYAFIKTYGILRDSDKDTFSKIVNKLLAQGSLYVAIPKDKEDYYFTKSYFETFEYYFSVMDYTIELYDVDRVIIVKNLHNYNRLSLKKDESILLLILRKIYYKKMLEVSTTNQIITTLIQLHKELEVTKLFDSRINRTRMREILSLFKNYNICQLQGDLSLDDTALVITPVIQYILPINQIEEIESAIKIYKQRGDNDENIDQGKVD